MSRLHWSVALIDNLFLPDGSKLSDGSGEELPDDPVCEGDFAEDEGSRSNNSNVHIYIFHPRPT